MTDRVGRSDPWAVQYQGASTPRLLMPLAPCTVMSDPVARQAKINNEAVLGKVIGSVLGKKDGENVVDITTTVDILPIFWEAEKVMVMMNCSGRRVPPYGVSLP